MWGVRTVLARRLGWSLDGAITVIRVGVGVGVGVRVRVRVEVSAWSSLGAGVAALPDDEGHEVRQFDVGLRV